MKGLGPHKPLVSRAKLPLLPLADTLPCCANFSRTTFSPSLKCRKISRFTLTNGITRAQASNINIGPGDYESKDERDSQNAFGGIPVNDSSSKMLEACAKHICTSAFAENLNERNGDNSNQTLDSLAKEAEYNVKIQFNPKLKLEKPPNQIPYLISIASVLFGCALVFALIAFLKGGPSSVLAAIAKTGFTAAFTLIFVSEIGDKTFFIAALLGMQYEKGLVLLGSMGALSLMTILSVVIGRIFLSVPAQFQTALPLGEYAAVTLLLVFGLKSIKDAWDLPSEVVKKGNNGNPELDELAEAEELVKEKVSRRLSNPFEIIWKSFSLVFFAEWGDRSMLATIALGAAQSPWGVASGAICGHLLATFLAILGGAFLANYISEKLVGYLGGGLFLVFAVATFFGVF